MRHNFDIPKAEKFANVGHIDDDIGVFANAITSFEPDSIDTLSDKLMELFAAHGLTRKTADALANFATKNSTHEEKPNHAQNDKLDLLIGELMSSENILLNVGALALASGIARDQGFQSEQSLATSLGVTRQAVSLRAQEWAELLGYRSYFLRSEETRKKCSDAQKADHWRKRL